MTPSRRWYQPTMPASLMRPYHSLVTDSSTHLAENRDGDCSDEVFKHDAVAEEIVNAELDLVLTKGKSVTDAIADAERMVARRAVDKF